jgi:hypothetical protein
VANAYTRKGVKRWLWRRRLEHLLADLMLEQAATQGDTGGATGFGNMPEAQVPGSSNPYPAAGGGGAGSGGPAMELPTGEGLPQQRGWKIL